MGEYKTKAFYSKSPADIADMVNEYLGDRSYEYIDTEVTNLGGNGILIIVRIVRVEELAGDTTPAPAIGHLDGIQIPDGVQIPAETDVRKPGLDIEVLDSEISDENIEPGVLDIESGNMLPDSGIPNGAYQTTAPGIFHQHSENMPSTGNMPE